VYNVMTGCVTCYLLESQL